MYRLSPGRNAPVSVFNAPLMSNGLKRSQTAGREKNYQRLDSIRGKYRIVECCEPAVRVPDQVSPTYPEVIQAAAQPLDHLRSSTNGLIRNALSRLAHHVQGVDPAVPLRSATLLTHTVRLVMKQCRRWRILGAADQPRGSCRSDFECSPTRKVEATSAYRRRRQPYTRPHPTSTTQSAVLESAGEALTVSPTVARLRDNAIVLIGPDRDRLVTGQRRRSSRRSPPWPRGRPAAPAFPPAPPTIF